MEKKLVLFLHVCSIEYMRLVLWLWSLELKHNVFIIKHNNFWFFIYFEKRKHIFIIVVLFSFSLLLYFELCCTYLNLAIFLIACFKLVNNHVACFKSIWTLPYFQLQGLTLEWNVLQILEYLNNVIFSIARFNLAV